MEFARYQAQFPLQAGPEPRILLPQRLCLLVGLIRTSRTIALLRCARITTFYIVCIRDPTLLIPLDAQLQQLRKSLRKVREEDVLVFRIPPDPRSERWVLSQRNVRRQHHKFLLQVLVNVYELCDAIVECLLPPVERQHQLEVLIAEAGRVVYPCAVEA